MRLFNFSHFNKISNPLLISPLSRGEKRTPLLDKGGGQGGGFTFIELVMVITIFTILSGVALFNFGDYSDSISLQNLAQQISLEIVQAQRDAISGRNPDFFGSNRPSYGIAFSSSQLDREKFIYFADIDNDGQFSQDEPNEEVAITRGNYIDSLNPSPSLTITFCRPYPDAYVETTGTFASCLSRTSSYPKAEIVIHSPRGNQKTIEVSSLGQVSVK